MREWFVYFPAGSIEPQIIPVTIADTDALLLFFYLTLGVESVEVVHFGRSGNSIMIVDEEGLLKPDPVPSPVGCALYPGYIVGGVIICQSGSRNGEPDAVGFETMPEAYAAAAAAKTVAQMYLARMQDPDTHEEP